jgi:hypothetical protein
MTSAQILKNCIEANFLKYLASHYLRMNSEYKIMVANRGIESLFPFVKEELAKKEVRGQKLSVDETLLYAVEYYMSNNNFSKPLAQTYFAPIPHARKFIDIVWEKMVNLGWQETNNGSLMAPPNVSITK